MANKAGLKDIAEQVFDNVPPAVLGLIDQAVRNDWSATEFIRALIGTEAFRMKFPGLMEGGTVAEFLTGQENAPPSIQNIATAITNYRTALHEYRQIAQRYGVGFTKKQFQLIIRTQTSADEFGARLRAIQKVQRTPGLEQAFNAQARAFGIETLNEEGVYRLAAGVADKKFYDVYEAAYIQNADLGFGKSGAARLARRIGEPGALTDIGAVVAEAKARLSDIAPELEAQGVSKAQLLRFLADPTADTSNIAPRLAQALASKRARGTYVAGQQGRRGPAGGLTLQPQERTASYG